MLDILDLQVSYGAIPALRGVSLTVEAGQIVALIGANGAGKSTLMRAIIGLVRPHKGRIIFRGREIQQQATEAIIRQGISLCPEGRRTFPHLTVLENLKLGAYWRPEKKVKADLELVLDLFPRLAERKTQPAGTLSGGEQQMLALGRALMSRPRLLLLDEPSLGLAPLLVQDLFQTLVHLNRQGTTILLVEQNAFAALKISHYAYVLEVGRLTLSGPAQELLRQPQIKQAYLGED